MTGRHAEWITEELIEALSAPPGVCDDLEEPHAWGDFCVNWTPLMASSLDIKDVRYQYIKNSQRRAGRTDTKSDG